MPAIDRGIGSEGLEQGGPSLGNDYNRKDLGMRDAGDALTTPNTAGLGEKSDDQDTLNMDSESSRNLSSEVVEDDDDLEDIDLDDDDLEDDDDDLLNLDDDDDEVEDETGKGQL
ncbi:MAG: hypothetical protein WKF97_04985 [Chitinophagaceae bacterium]